jgi:hypothetical protein
MEDAALQLLSYLHREGVTNLPAISFGDGISMVWCETPCPACATIELDGAISAYAAPAGQPPLTMEAPAFDSGAFEGLARALVGAQATSA